MEVGVVIAQKVDLNGNCKKK